jgi:hypothetical protein
MKLHTKAVILLVALLATLAAVEAIVRGTSGDEVLRLARQAGDHRLFTVVAQSAPLSSLNSN